MKTKLIIFGVALVLLLVAIQISVSRAEPDSCPAKVDVVIALDRTASMNYTSKCDWWQLKCTNPPSCSFGYNWVQTTTYNQNQSWCTAKNQTAPHQSVWTDYGPNKMEAAKQAAKNFLDLLGTDDQSSLVSFITTATLNKTLSDNHTSTKTAIDSLVTSGSVTDIGSAINLSNQELQSARANAGAKKAIILLTDGTSDATTTLAKANEAAVAGIKIFTIGLGSEINPALLQTIASTTGGKYYFAATAIELNNIFISLNADMCSQQPVCGDGIKNGTEECDGTDGVGENQSCSDTCTLINLPYCGDGIVNGSEQCDDGNTTNGDGCTSTCQTETPAPVCGNGIIESGEQCDDGNTNNGDGCDNNCQYEVCQSGGCCLGLVDANGQNLGIVASVDTDQPPYITYVTYKKLDSGQEIMLTFMSGDSSTHNIISNFKRDIYRIFYTQSDGVGEPFIEGNNSTFSSYIKSKYEVLYNSFYGYFLARIDTRGARTANSYRQTSDYIYNIPALEIEETYLITPITFPFSEQLAWPLEVVKLDGQNCGCSDGQNGINCWDLNGNGVNDSEEDVNLDGNFNALDCKGLAGEPSWDEDRIAGLEARITALEKAHSIPKSYFITTLTPDAKSRGKASINNKGEVVWEEVISGFAQIVSNKRGQITYNNTDHSHANINDNDEIVWMELESSNFYQVMSNIRGQITSGDKNHFDPVIVNSGEIIWAEVIDGYGQIFSNTRGQLTTGNISHSAPGINSSGELIWQQNIDGNDQIFSSLRGQITSGNYWHWNPSINDKGIITWHEWPNGLPEAGQVAVNVYGLVTSGDSNHYNPSINNEGVVVYDEWAGTGYKIMMATPIY